MSLITVDYLIKLHVRIITCIMQRILIIAIMVASAFARQTPQASRTVTFVNKCTDDVQVWKYGVTKNVFDCGAKYGDKDAFIIERGKKIVGTWKKSYDIAFVSPMKYTDEYPEGVAVPIFDRTGKRIIERSLDDINTKEYYKLSCENSDDPPEGPFDKMSYDSIYYLCKM
jgi:hypothetical protein